MTTTSDPIAAFLASKPETGLSPAVYEAEKTLAAAAAASWRPSCPQLAYLQTPDQLTPDPREAVVEAVLTVAGDRDDIDIATTIVGALRPDLDQDQILAEIHHLYELSEEAFRAQQRGDHTVFDHMACRYENALADLAGAR